MTHLCSDRVSHKKRCALIRKPQVGKALSSPPKAGRWVRFREQTRVISRECRSQCTNQTEEHLIVYGVGGGEKGYQNGGEVVPCQGSRSE
jgi:hypothetical protein